MDAISNSLAAASASQKSATSLSVGSGAASFATVLASAQAKDADYVSGRLGIELNSQGAPAQVVYYSDSGERLTSSGFSAQAILRETSRLGIGLEDLRGLGDQLATDGVGYKPYELYRGTGSDHGIDFDDLIAGGLGTAYDWTKDANVALKGPGALAQLEAARALAEGLGLTKHAAVTDERGIDPARFEPAAARDRVAARNYVAFNGSVGSWHETSAAAQMVAGEHGGGRVINLVEPRATTASTNSGRTPISSGESTAIPATESDGEEVVTETPVSVSLQQWDRQLQSLINTAKNLGNPTGVGALLDTLTALLTHKV